MALFQDIGSGRARRASDRGLLPMTLESYLTLLETGRVVSCERGPAE